MGGGSSGSLGELAQVLEKFTKDFKKEMEDQTKHLKDVLGAKSSVDGKRAANKKTKPVADNADSLGSDDYLDDVSDNYKFMNALESSLQKNKLKFDRQYLATATQNIRTRHTELSHLDEKAFLAKLESETYYKKALADETLALKQNISAARQLRDQFSEIQSMLGSFEQSLGLKTTETLFGGIVEQEMKFTQEIRATAYETAGATKEARGLQRAFEDIGKSVAQTGVNRTEFQKSYQQALRSGVKDLKQAGNLTTAQLNTEKQLGMEAGSLQDTFQDLAMSGRMNSGQIADMGRGMRDVAKATGLTGEALRGAIDSSKELIRDLRNASQLTAASAKNVIEISANAKKLGVESEVNNLMKGLVSSNNLILDASNETRTLILQAASKVGRVEDAMNGTITRSKEGIKDLAKGMEKILKDFGVNGVEEIDNLSDTAKRDLNLRIKAVYGMELGQFRSTLESMKESGKGLGDRLEDINKKLQQNATTEEKKVLMEQQRQLKTSKQLEVLTALDEAAKGAKDMGQALSKFGDRKKDFEKDMQALGTSWTSETQVARDAIKGSLESVNEGLKKAGKEEIKISSDEIEKAIKDPTALRELTAKITKGEQQLATAQKAQLDPVTETNQKLTEINDTLRNMSQNVISKLFNSFLGKIIMIGGVLSGIGAAVIGLGVTGKNAYDTLGKLIKGGQDLYGGKQESFVSNIKKYFGIGGKKNATPEGGASSPTEAAAAAAAAAAATAPKETAPKSAEAVTKATTEGKGGRYVKILEESLKELNSISNTMSQSSLFLQKISECICRPRKAAAAGTPPGAGGTSADSAARVALQREQKTNVKTDAKLNEKQLKEQNKEIKRGKREDIIQRAETKGAKAAAKESKGGKVDCPPTAEAGCLEPSVMENMGAEMKKAAPAILMFAAGALLLGIALMWLANKLLAALNLDAAKIAETAESLIVIVGVTAAIAAAAYAAGKVLMSEEMQDFVKSYKEDKAKIIEAAKVLMIMGPALLLLGAGLVAFAGYLIKTLGIDMSMGIEIAGGVVVIAGVTAGIAIAVKEFVEAYEELSANATWQKILNNKKKIAMEIAKGALALIVLGAVILTVAIAVVKFADLLMGAFGISPQKAAEVATGVAALLLATGVIALGVYAGYRGLQLLSTLGAEIYASFGASLAAVGLGAYALLILGPIILGVAVAVTKFCQLLLGAFGLDAATATKVAYDVGALLLATGIIAAGILAATYGLKYLSTLYKELSDIIKKMLKGAFVLFALGAPVLLLAAAVIGITKLFLALTGLDSAKTAKAAEDLATLLVSAGMIALAVIGASYGISYLGANAGALMALIWPMFVGAGVLILLSLAVGVLAAAINYMASAIIKGTNPKKAAETSEALGSLLTSSGKIALAIIGASASSALLAGMLLYVPYLIVAMFVAAVVLALLSVALTAFVRSVIGIADQMMLLGSPKALSKKAETVAGILKAAGDVAQNIMDAKDKVKALYESVSYWDYFFGIRRPLIKGTKVLEEIKWPLVLFAIEMMNFHWLLTRFVSAPKAIAAGKQVAAILGAMGDVAQNMVKTKDAVAALAPSYLGSCWPKMLTFAPTMEDGVKALETIKQPLIDFVISMIDFHTNLLSQTGSSAPKIIAAGRQVAQIFKATGEIAEGIMKTKDAVAALAPSKLGAHWPACLTLTPTLADGTEALKTMEEPLIDFIKEVKVFADKLEGVVNPAEVKKYSGIIRNATSLISQVVRMLDILSKKLVPLTTGGWFSESPIKQIGNATVEISAWFGTIAVLLKTGIIEPIKENFPAEEELKIVTGKLNNMVKVLDALPPVLDKLGSLVGQYAVGGWFTVSPIAAIGKFTDIFAKWFTSIAMMLRTGIVNPVMDYFPGEDEIEDAALRLDGMVTILNKIPPVLDTLGDLLNTYTAGNWFELSPIGSLMVLGIRFGGWFNGVGMMLRDGVINPVLKYFPAEDEVTEIVSRLEGMVVVLNKLGVVLGELGFVMSALSSISMPFGFMNLFPMASLGGMLTGLAGATSGIGSLFSGGGKTSVGTPSDNAIDKRVEQQSAEAAQMQAGLLAKLVDQAIYGDGINVQSAGNAAVTSKTTASTIGANMADIQSKVAAQKAGNQLPSSKVSSDELADIATESETQTELQKKLVGLFEDMLKALKPADQAIVGQAGAGPADTSGEKVGGKPPNYFRSSQGMVNSGPGKQTLNMGPQKA